MGKLQITIVDWYKLDIQVKNTYLLNLTRFTQLTIFKITLDKIIGKVP